MWLISRVLLEQDQSGGFTSGVLTLVATAFIKFTFTYLIFIPRNR
jgi:hypothetical protein